MNTTAAITYWVITGIWLSIIATVGRFYFSNPRTFGTTRLLLAVLGLDALRNIIENIYFGLFFGSKYGLFPAGLAQVLGNPSLLILPKLSNIVAGCIVLSVLLLKWLPQEICERAEAERQVKSLHELATIDAMTGLQNRGHFMTLSETEWQRCKRYNRPLSLLILDIDNFKAVNDQYGHGVGDQVIILISTLCSHAKRLPDIAGRLGGEELAILLPETTINDAKKFAERLRDLVSRESFKMFDGHRTTTVSIGLSESTAACSVSELFKQADTALYKAKRAGRNQVCGHGAA